MKQRVFVTGATGGMGFASLKEMLKDTDKQDIVILARDSEKNRALLAPYMQTKGLLIEWGDLNDYQVVKKCVKGCDLVLHIAAFVSPAADYYPERAMKVNYGSTKNIINAIYDCGQENSTCSTTTPSPKWRRSGSSSKAVLSIGCRSVRRASSARR